MIKANNRRTGGFGWWHEIVLLSLLVTLLMISQGLIPGFLAWKSQLYLSRHLWETAILSVGMTLIILTGGIDLSVGSSMGMCAVAFGWLFQQSQSIALAATGCVVVGALGGALNGTLISRYQVHPLIVTLSTYAVFRGVAEGASQGREFSPFPDAFAEMTRRHWMGLPLPSWCFLGLAILIGAMLSRTPTGRFLYAMGHSEQAARFSGVRVERIKLWLYTFMGMLAGLTTVIHISRFGTARASAGSGLELNVITAVVVGGTSIFGGRGNLIGTALGALLIHETGLFVSRYWRIDELKPMVIGGLLVVSVLVYRLCSRQSDDELDR